jgi:hypothetical protein
MNKAVKIILFTTGALTLLAVFKIGAANGDVQNVSASRHKGNVAAAWNKHAIDSATQLLQTGNVLLRMGMGAQSKLLALMNRTDKSYSHCGIVLVENGYPFVYHSIGGEDNPDARLRRDSAKDFLSPEFNTAIAIVHYDLPPENEAELQKTVSRYYRNRPKFDLQFDLTTDDKLYCTEFVYKVLNEVAGDTTYIPSTSLATRKFIGTDNLYTNRHANLVWQVKFK